MSPEDWRATSWADKRMYLDGLIDDETVPISMEEGGAQGLPTGAAGPTIRSNVEAGTDVIDLNAMRAELEAERLARKGGGP